jgi:hypothetical protein
VKNDKAMGKVIGGRVGVGELFLEFLKKKIAVFF